jgi:pimeloyl-ACP methyl ester carboxylesterase
MNTADFFSKNSTNGRTTELKQAAFRALAALAPGLAEERAAELFMTPRPKTPAAPETPGLPGHRFEIEAGPNRLAAWDFGQGPTVLLAHGWDGQAAQMSGFIPALVKAGVYVVAFDMPAHGGSSGERATLLDLAEAVRAVGRRVGPVHGVVAHSLGATAAALAISGGLAVSRAVLIAPPAEVPFFARAVASRLGLSAERAEGMLARVARRLGVDFEALDLRKLAPRQRAPLLVIHDPADREVPFAHGRDISAAWPDARLLALSRLGHTRALKDPGVIDAAVGFLRAE